ncbi:MAG: hypothetical protein JW825_00215 [Candidatus Methanofastidiosa archaeon]|nr:hypothetical protein [Candidatus Methanofastidiosa archaeon]
MIISKSFKHGWYYWFRYDRQKIIDHFRNIIKDPILDYFDAIDDCPHIYFCQEPRASSLRSPRLYVTRIRHPITKFTEYGKKVYKDRYSSNHSRVEMFLLENDMDSVAVEVPVWFEEDESTEHGFDYPLTGHIDLLRLTDKIEIWDYKPKADKELYASTQVYWYSRMLSSRLGLPLDEFRCGYFDEDSCYLVDIRSL